MFLTFVAPRTSGWQCNLMRAPPGGDACWLGRCQGNRSGNGRGTRESICQHSWRWRRRAKPKLPVECVFDCPLAASQSNFSCNSNSESCSSPASASAQQLLSIMACDPPPPRPSTSVPVLPPQLLGFCSWLVPKVIFEQLAWFADCQSKVTYTHTHS